MGRVDETVHAIDYKRGGLVFTDNIETISPNSMVFPTRNLNLNRGGREPRGGTDQLHSGYGGARKMGGKQFILNDGTKYYVVVTTDGKIWKDESTSIHTFATTGKYPSFEVFNNKLYICNDADLPQVWTGTGNTTDMANPHTDWITLGYPKAFKVHSKENSDRLWAINDLYANASAVSTGSGEADFTAGNLDFYIERGGRSTDGLVAIYTHGDRLFVASKVMTKVLKDEDTSTANWYFSEVSWKKGVAHQRLAIDTPYGTLCVTDQFDIYPIDMAQEYGDYKITAIMEKAYVKSYVNDHVNLAYIEDCHGIYDPKCDAIKIFHVRSGKTTIDTALCYFLERSIEYGAEEAWMIHDNTAVASGYSASCSTSVEVSPGVHQIYTGGYTGITWRLEQATKADEGNGYTAGWTTPRDSFASLNVQLVDMFKLYERAKLRNQPTGTFTMNVSIYVDGEFMETQALSIAGIGAVYGTAVFGTDQFALDAITSEDFILGFRGKDNQFYFNRTGAGEDFFVPSFIQHFEPLEVDVA